MSTKSKLLAMTEDLQLPSPGEAVASVPSSSPPGTPPPLVPRTGPGQMMQFRGHMLAAEAELGKVKEQLAQHEGSVPSRLLDPTKIRPSKWANRHDDSFRNSEFESLKQDIASAGGNVQAISVRPIDDGQFEIIFGHRRHRACLELGLPVLASIATLAVSDSDLFMAMDRENRERADLSPFEQGLMYRRALDAGLFASNRRLAEALSVSHTWVANVLLVADLPSPILQCFHSPLEVQYRHAKALSQALDTDRKGVLRRAEKLRQAGKRLSASGVVDALIPRADPTGTKSPVVAIRLGDRVVGDWSTDSTGRLVLRLEKNVFEGDDPAGAVEKLVAALRKE